MFIDSNNIRNKLKEKAEIFRYRMNFEMHELDDDAVVITRDGEEDAEKGDMVFMDLDGFPVLIDRRTWAESYENIGGTEL